jgi:hypothetical protein
LDAFNYSLNSNLSLTMPKHRRNSNGGVTSGLTSFYARWRVQCGVVPVLREDHESPPERLLQAIWQHQRLLRGQLETLDGQILRVLHPGFVSAEGGPDFRGAVVQFGDAPPRAGDVEVDIHPGNWRAHGHDRNPAFQKVILHVIWDGDRPVAGAPPCLKLRQVLDAPVGELSFWLSAESALSLPENLRGQCCAPLRELAPEKLAELLRDAAQIRFRGKAAHLQARARQAGWEQALWEGIFRALGYKHNTWPMHCLAEHRANWFSPQIMPLALQARLFGVSGLLPAELSRAQASADGYLRRIWDQWWREREEFADCTLPRSVWRFHGQRPANHPQRRLALAAHWLASGSLAGKIERWCATGVPDKDLSDSLLEVLQIERDDFWSWHWTMRSARLKKPQPLLGAARAADLAVNVILPWLWVRAAEGKSESVQHVIERRFQVWPPAEDNAVLRLARQRLLGGATRRALRNAVEQQGLIQIVRDFCDHSNAVCQDCHFPEMVREWGRAT